jgi:hypothetical protein
MSHFAYKYCFLQKGLSRQRIQVPDLEAEEQLREKKRLTPSDYGVITMYYMHFCVSN